MHQIVSKVIIPKTNSLFECIFQISYKHVDSKSQRGYHKMYTHVRTRVHTQKRKRKDKKI